MYRVDNPLYVVGDDVVEPSYADVPGIGECERGGGWVGSCRERGRGESKQIGHTLLHAPFTLPLSLSLSLSLSAHLALYSQPRARAVGEEDAVYASPLPLGEEEDLQRGSANDGYLFTEGASGELDGKMT